MSTSVPECLREFTLKSTIIYPNVQENSRIWSSNILPLIKNTIYQRQFGIRSVVSKKCQHFGKQVDNASYSKLALDAFTRWLHNGHLFLNRNRFQPQKYYSPIISCKVGCSCTANGMMSKNRLRSKVNWLYFGTRFLFFTHAHSRARIKIKVLRFFCIGQTENSII